jgi:Leucine-rich repeat (LRR) protein
MRRNDAVKQIMLLPLHSLSLVRNNLSSIESSITQLTTLLKLDVSHNALTGVPRQMHVRAPC